MTTKTKRLGRKPKKNPAVFRYSVNLTEDENAKFLSLFDASEMKTISGFISACLLNKPIKVVKIDKATKDYYIRLTTFHSQFRAIGVNYNQITKSIKSSFTEKKALAFLYKLEKATIDLAQIAQKIIELTDEFEKKWLRK